MRILLVIALAMVLFAVVPGSAQNTENLQYKIEIDKNAKGENEVVESRDDKGTLYVTVRFKVLRLADGGLATDVDKDDLIVRENNRKVEELEIFVPRAALTTVLAMDISGSMANTSGSSGSSGVQKMDEAKKAAGIFLDHLTGKSETGLILFDHEMKVKEPPLRDPSRYAAHRQKIRRLIEEEAKPSGGTAYLDAAAQAVEMLKGIEGRRAVVIMTDGVDMNSQRTMGEVIKSATVHQVPIYTLGIGELGKYKNVTTVLVLDHSGSMKGKADATDKRSKIDALHTAASRFVELMRRDAMTTLLPFSSTVDVADRFTDDKRALVARIRFLKPEGGTLLYDATYDGIETLVAARREGRNAVVVLTDGKDEAPGSRYSDQLVIDRAKEAKVPLYMLGLGQPEEINESVMKRMAKETGGKYFHAGSEQRLFEIFEKLSIDLHDDGINEKELRTLAEKTGGKFFWARDASKLPQFFGDLATELQSTYTVKFRSRLSQNDGTARAIDISVERNGVRLSNVGSADYNVHGVVVPEMDYRVYLVLLALLGVFLLAPMGVRQLHRLYGGS
ncbi:MAG TPA: VWA domain-containing protein [Gemmataceae bacterium]|nr:VWA domain-containing protein [Gemmataceae bacterium]